MTQADLLANPSLWISDVSVLNDVDEQAINQITSELAQYIALYRLADNQIPKINIRAKNPF